MNIEYHLSTDHRGRIKGCSKKNAELFTRLWASTVPFDAKSPVHALVLKTVLYCALCVEEDSIFYSNKRTFADLAIYFYMRERQICSKYVRKDFYFGNKYDRKGRSVFIKLLALYLELPYSDIREMFDNRSLYYEKYVTSSNNLYDIQNADIKFAEVIFRDDSDELCLISDSNSLLVMGIDLQADILYQFNHYLGAFLDIVESYLTDIVFFLDAQ